MNNVFSKSNVDDLDSFIEIVFKLALMHGIVLCYLS